MPDGFSQAHRLIRLTTNLGSEALIPETFDSIETFGSGFTYKLTAFSESEHELKAKDLVATKATVTLIQEKGDPRFFNGFIQAFKALGSSRAGQQSRYSITIVSAFEMLLSKRTDCRIFQGLSAKDVINEVFTTYSDIRPLFELAGTPATRRYCVQYNETDLNFVKRLCRQEGWSFYFRHTETDHQLVFVDDANMLADGPQKKIPLQQGTSAHDHLTSLRAKGEFASGKFEQRAFNYKTPTAPISVTTSSSATVAETAKVTSTESYIFNETFVDSDQGGQQIEAMSKAATQRSQIFVGEGNTRNMCVGSHFEIELAEGSQGLNGEFALKGEQLTLISLTIHADNTTGASKCSIEATPKGELIYPKGTQPRIQGLQTAIVTGPEGKEIHTDVEGRIKVQFHWDRLGANNENTTAWMRVMQSFAGAGFGGHFTPRIGQEVVVAFENGNPDRPFVLGALYHPEHLPPYGDQQGTRAGIRTRSTEGGGASNYNELYFEDKLGNEEVYLQAEKDHNVWIKNDEGRKVDNNKTQTIGVNETKTVGENYTEEVGSNSDVKVGTNYTIDVGDTLAITAGSEITLTVGGSSIKITGSKIEVSSSAVAIDGSTVDVTGLINLN